MRAHKKKKLDAWEQIHPKTGNCYEGMEIEFVVFKEEGKHFFVARQIFLQALGLKSFYRYLTDDNEGVIRKRIQKGCMSTKCISEKRLQEILYSIRHTAKKTSLILYLNTNYDVWLRSVPTDCKNCNEMRYEKERALKTKEQAIESCKFLNAEVGKLTKENMQLKTRVEELMNIEETLRNELDKCQKTDS